MKGYLGQEIHPKEQTWSFSVLSVDLILEDKRFDYAAKPSWDQKSNLGLKVYQASDQ